MSLNVHLELSLKMASPLNQEGEEEGTTDNILMINRIVSQSVVGISQFILVGAIVANSTEEVRKADLGSGPCRFKSHS